MGIAETTQDFVSCVVLILTGWLTLYRNGQNDGCGFRAYKHYHACSLCTRLAAAWKSALTRIELHINSLLLECIHVVYYSKAGAQGEVFQGPERRVTNIQTSPRVTAAAYVARRQEGCREGSSTTEKTPSETRVSGPRTTGPIPRRRRREVRTTSTRAASWA